MKLKELILIEFEQKLETPYMAAGCVYDKIVFTNIIESKEVYNLDHIFKVSKDVIYLRTNIMRGEVHSTVGEPVKYLVVQFINGETIVVKGTVKELGE